MTICGSTVTICAVSARRSLVRTFCAISDCSTVPPTHQEAEIDAGAVGQARVAAAGPTLGALELGERGVLVVIRPRRARSVGRMAQVQRLDERDRLDLGALCRFEQIGEEDERHPPNISDDRHKPHPRTQPEPSRRRSRRR